MPFMFWQRADQPPDSMRVVVGLQRIPATIARAGTKQFFFYERVFVQWDGKRWTFMGSDQKCRNLSWWCDLPPIPAKDPT